MDRYRCAPRLALVVSTLTLFIAPGIGCQATTPATEAVEVAAAPVRVQSQDLHDDVVRHAPAQIEPKVDWRGAAIERAPMSLTAGDGSGLRLVSITGDVVVEDPLAFCELHLTFENPEDRRREGRFEFDLPPDAALSRLAMQIGSRWMEGEVVERQRGRETFEDYIHWRPKVDPALLEQAAANRVSARVFPILPHERKQIIVSYSQPLASGDRSLRLPLQGLPQLEVLDLHVVVSGGGGEPRVIEVREHDFAPTHDLVVDLDGAQDAGAVRAGALAVIRVRPQLRPSYAAAAAGDEGAITELTVLFDTSASAARSFDREVDRLGALLETLGDAPVRVVAFDQEVALIHDGPAAQALGAPLAALRERRAFGASNLHGALSHELVRAAASERLLIWSDGVATAGETETAPLVAAARALGRARIDVYPVTTAADRDLLASLSAAATRGGVVLGLDLDGPALLDALRRPSLEAVRVDVEGASWSYPRSLEGVAAGDDVVVYARFPQAAPDEVHVAFSDPRLVAHAVPVPDGAAPLVERAVARAEVEELEHRLDQTPEPAAAEALRKQLVALAIDNRLLTKHTALLVLESGDEYRRHGIRRRARKDILGIGEDGVETVARGKNRAPAVAGEVEGLQGLIGGGLELDGGLAGGLAGVSDLGSGGLRDGGGFDEGTIGLGNTGLIGKGSGSGSGYGHGYGYAAPGEGAGFGRRGKAVPRVRQAKATIAGAIDPTIIRRIVRAHINEIRSCYNAGLARNPTLAGRVVVRFQITGTGTVGTSQVAEQSLGNAEVASCMAKAARRWKFPTPPGGTSVIVSYPFELEPGQPPTAGQASSNGWMSHWGGRHRRPGGPSDPDGERWSGSPHAGRFGVIQAMVAGGQPISARAEAWSWATTEPDNALALIALGQQLSFEDPALAARVYGSLIDLHPHRADIRRGAGERLAALGEVGRDLAIDSYRKAIAQRPDQINGHRLLAWTLVEAGQLEEAFDVLQAAIATDIPADRFRGAKSLMREDLEILATVALASGTTDPAFLERIRVAGVQPATTASLRLAASWETDATDVDLLVEPIGGGTGKRLADVRSGFGPEAWIARGDRRPLAVTARVRYFNRRAMGFALGTVAAIEHDGVGGLRIQQRPFVLMQSAGAEQLGRFGG